MNKRRVFIGYTQATCGAFISFLLCACGGNSNPNTEGDTQPEVPPFFIGNHGNTNHIRDDFSLYWNQLTPEFEGFWGQIENTRNQYNWQKLDILYGFASRHGLPVKAHALISRDMAPNWINSLPSNLLAEEIQSWIRDYCTRYPNTPMINVVYNAMPGHSSTGIFAGALGENWVVQTFQWAREYCPDSLLILDDHSLLSTDTDEFIEWARPIIASGFVDALGAQAQALEDTDPQLIAANLDKLANFGLPIYISEWEIAEADDLQQLIVMQQQLPIFYHHPSVAGITYWGYIAGHQFKPYVHLLHEDDSPRPAMVWLQEYMRDNPRD